MFCITDLNNAGNTSFKTTDEDFEALTASDAFVPAPHLARAKWVKVVRPDSLKRTDWKAHIARSYELVRSKLPKKVQAHIGTG